jgi:peptidoglycan hydrolase-like protein with peptidoglycan-binding domain
VVYWLLVSLPNKAALVQKFSILLLLLASFLPSVARADETTRQVQEELRQRHLYFNEIDGRNSPELQNALRRYQQRQGFAASGQADEATLRSLGIQAEPAPPAEGDAMVLPDVPVLRSDERVPDRNARPALPPPEVASQARAITRPEASEFVKRWLTAVESPNVHDELALYGDRVDYYDHGIVDRQYVQNELAAYDQHWPRRSYRLAGPVRLRKQGDATTVTFRMAYQVGNAPTNRRAGGRIDQTFGLARRADGNLELVSLREHRVRRTSRGTAVRARSEDPVVHGVRKIFRGIFHR